MKGRRSSRRNNSSSDDVAGRGTPNVPGYRDLSVIGRGASATVYRAVQQEYDRDVAVKVINVDISDRRARRRFDRERSLNGRLSSHPNVVTVLDSGVIDGRMPFLTMELYEHGSFADRLDSHGPLSVGEALHVGVRIAGALESAHRLGVLHRDVKPQNLLRSGYGEPALADFGIAGLLEMDQSFTAALTPVHAAPELLEGADPSAQSDVWALASSIHMLLTGTAPFAGPSGEGVLAQLLRITTSEMPTLTRADAPKELSELLREAAAKRPEERISSAAQFGRRLQAIEAVLGATPTIMPVEADVDDTDTAPYEPHAGLAILPQPEPNAPWPGPNDPATEPRVWVTPDDPPSEAPVRPSTNADDETVDPFISAADLESPDTVDESPADHTVMGRQALAIPPKPDVAPRWRKPVTIVAGAVIGIGVAVFGFSQLGGDDANDVENGDSSTDTQTTIVAPESVDGNDGVAPPVTTAASVIVPDPSTPQNVRAEVRGSAVWLLWDDATAGANPHVITVAGADAAASRLQSVRPGEVGEVEVDGVAATDDVCLQVGAVLNFGSEVSEQARAEPVCLNDAQITSE